MTNVLLKDWDWARRYWMLDTSTGSAQPSDGGLYHGFLSAFAGPERRTAMPRVAAVYAEDEKLWFQVDERRWEVRDVEFGHKLDGVTGASQFTVLRNGQPVVDIMYLGPAADPLNRIDPAFDTLDMEMQDLFYYLARNSKDPGFGTGWLAAWNKGVPAED